MFWFDSHCHLDFDEFDTKTGQKDQNIVTQCQLAGVEKLLVPGVKQATLCHLVQLCQQKPGLYAACGWHPCFLDQHSMKHFHQLADLACNPSVVAIGECGLDFCLNPNTYEQQYTVFTAQVQLAYELDRPLIIHARRSLNQVLQCLQQSSFHSGGIVHAYSGSLEQAKPFLELGFKLGFGGALTYPNTPKLQRTLKGLPLEAIVLETDAPDMRPAFAKDQVNSPLHLPKIGGIIADLLEIPVEHLAHTTYQNTCEALRIAP